nr:glycine-rich protein 1-like [Aegilops tauschii subsp. strangulata]
MDDASATAAGGGGGASTGVEDTVPASAGVGDDLPTIEVGTDSVVLLGAESAEAGDPSPPTTRPGARSGAARAASRAENATTPVGGFRGRGRERMPDCAVGGAATSDLGGSLARDRRPPAAGAAMREARAAAASAAAAAEASYGVGDDDADARALSSASRA